MRTSKPFIKNRNKLSASKPVFIPNLVPGNSLKDIVSQTGSTTSISGARWGIVNGVVAQFAENVPHVEDNGLRGCPAFTQLAKYSEDLTNAAWGKVLCSVSLHSTFQGKNIFKLVENLDTNAQHYLQQAGIFGLPADNSILGISIIAKKDTRSRVRIDFQDKNASYPMIATIDLNTGLLGTPNSGTTYISIVPLGDDFYSIFLAANAGVGGSNNPRFRVMLDNGTTSQYNGDGVSGVYLGQPTYINFGVSGIPFIPPYVPNNTTSSVSVVSETATATTGTSFDLDDSKLVKFKEGFDCGGTT